MTARQMRGFTLVEVVIAFAILGISLAALYGSFENALARTQHDARFREGTMILQSLLARAGSEVAPDQASYRDQWKGYTCELMQEPLGLSDHQSGLTQAIVRVTAKVEWAEGDRSRDIEASTLKFVHRGRP